MTSEIRHIFEPTLGLWEWIAVIIPVALMMTVLAIGIRASVGFRARQASRLMRLSLFATSAVASALLSIAYTGRDRLATVSFSEDSVEISGPLRHEVFKFRAANHAKADSQTVELKSDEKSVRFPASGTWQLGNLTVDGSYLANEFVGRSRETGSVAASR